MTHTSDQAVASQDQAAPEPQEDPPHRSRFLIGWATALAALGVSTLLLGGGLWFTRFSIAELLIGAALSERGADADFDVVALDFDHAVLSGVRFGAETAPDAAISTIEARWVWNGLLPKLNAVRVIEPRLRVRLDPQGRVSAGALDRIEGRPSPRRASIPAIRLDIVDGQALIEAPFGAVTATFNSEGVLGENFSARALIADSTREGAGYALRNGAADLTITSQGGAIGARLFANAAALTWNGAAIEGADLRLTAQIPLDLSRMAIDGAWRVTSLRAPNIEADGALGAVRGEAVSEDDALEPRTWRASTEASAGRFTFADNTMRDARLSANAEGTERQGRGDWRLDGARFAGLAMTSEAPSAAGAFTLDWREAFRLDGGARLNLAQTRLDARAQQRIRDALPNLPQAPVGPQLAAAEAALDRAADRFDLVIPMRIISGADGARVVLNAPTEARAANGVRLALAPLRADRPALQLDLATLTLQGAAALELSGGGGPQVSLLLDTISWAKDSPLDADGTLSLANWRVDGSEIAASELGLSAVIQPNGDGAVDLRGPVRITGPLGDGQVRDMVAALNIAVHWGQGWRVTTPRECVPITLGGLDAAGLSFADGRFSLCALDNTLIAADARGNLSGGFAIQTLALNGRMAGPEAQPARLSTRLLTGRFGGVEGDVRLALNADAPSLRIDMAPERTLNLVMARLTAEARIDDSWRLDGAFDHGGLNDPSLPGGVSAIAGRWSAAPEDGKPVIRVMAGEALLEANRPASDAERPLFNPMRLAEVNAVLRDGRIDAEGAVLLDDGARQLARFTARHEMSEGVGGADILATNIVFGEELQPYEITELARGLVDNVRGPASIDAGAIWTRDSMRTSARVRLNGVSLASATIPVISDVRGEINFDDLLAMTTPPGQEVRVGTLNPGVAVNNGRVRFQLRENGVISIEQAEFAFAGGVLAMRPETITLGADETEVALYLRDVDAATLISELKIPDLQASGRIEGSFPLRLTRQHAIVTDGVLRAAGGGRIAYTGGAGEHTEGVTRVAFDALRDFRYDELALTLNGDLNGEVVSDIRFTGENVGEPIDLSPVASLPGIGRVTMLGVPFRFNVKVTAPFRSLADTAATIIDPASLINRRTNEPEVDQDAQEPR